MNSMQALLETLMGLSFLGLAVVLCLMGQPSSGQDGLCLKLGLALLAIVFSILQVRRWLSDRSRSREEAALQAALRAYSEMRSEALNLCAGVTVSLSLCCHYCFSDPRKIYAEINRLWGAIEEFQQVRLAKLDDLLLGPGATEGASRALQSRP